jgi:hypothetical protein
MKQPLILIFLILLACGCKEGTSKENTSEVISIATIFEEYYKFKDRINPIEATKGGNYEYNDFIANYISDSYQEDLKKNYFFSVEDFYYLNLSLMSFELHYSCFIYQHT